MLNYVKMNVGTMIGGFWVTTSAGKIWVEPRFARQATQ